MNQVLIGNFITKKRKEKNMTQEVLAEKIGVSNKTISKWENGKCMPDYGVVETLCAELSITINELLSAGENEDKLEDTQVLELMKKIEKLENDKNIISGVLLIIMGIALAVFSKTFGGSNVKDFVSGLLLGISIANMIVGVYVAGKYATK